MSAPIDKKPEIESSLFEHYIPQKMMQNAIETGRFWANGYREVKISTVLRWRWKQNDEVRHPLEIIKQFPDHLKPLLPEGYLWFKSGSDLRIFKHEDAPPSLKIDLFGPDKNEKQNPKERIQYLVTNGGIPIHGFAMTKPEGFSTALRQDFPVTTESYGQGKTVWVRGHIIDYADTIGGINDGEISTKLPQNYKPEPDGGWAITLRKVAVANVREISGSYSELILYSPNPSMTDGKVSIPDAVLMETFTPTHERLNGYFVPKNHPCHKSTSYSQTCLRELSRDTGSTTFPPLVVKSIPGGILYWVKLKPQVSKH